MIVVSTYDKSVVYVNRAAVGLLSAPGHEIEPGDDVREAINWQAAFPDTCLGKALSNDNPETYSGDYLHHLGWITDASVLEPGDVAIMTAHFKRDDHAALHELMTMRAFAGRQMDRAMRMSASALDSLTEAQRNLVDVSRAMVRSAKASQVRPVSSAVQGQLGRRPARTA